MPRTHWITRLWKPLQSRRRDRHGQCFRPFLEALEGRFLLSGNIYTVNSLTDTGDHTSQYEGDLRYCINQADANPGSTIQFSSDLAGKTITLTQGQLNISDIVTINGLGASSLTIEGNKSSRLFEVTSGGSLTVDNVTLSGGLAEGTGANAEGGAIYSAGTLALTGVVVKSNTARGSNGTGASAYGGGLYVASGAATLNNDTLSNNKAIGGNGAAGRVQTVDPGGPGGVGSGGGLCVASGTVNLTDDTLSNNRATGGNGGDGYTQLRSNGGNGGKGSGGSLDVKGGTVTLLNDTLSSNQAVGGKGGKAGVDVSGKGLDGAVGSSFGGSIYNAGTLTVSHSTLSGNSAGFGGGIYNRSRLVVGSSTLSHNLATGSGGGIYSDGPSMTVSDSNLSYNTAAGGGGGIFNAGSLTVSSSTLSYNSATTGGGIDNSGLFAIDSLTVSSSTLSDNFAGERGGGIFNDGSLTVSSSTLSANTANEFGGGIYNAGNLTVSNSTISSNRLRTARLGNGGGIFNNASLKLLGTNKISGNTPDNIVSK